MQHRRQKLILWGAGGHGKSVADALLTRNDCDLVGIIDDDPSKLGKSLLGIQIRFSNLREITGTVDCDGIAIAIGDNYTRYQKLMDVKKSGFKTVNVIHPSAHISRFVELGEGVTILAGATVNAGTVIEDGTCVNTSASVDHDNHLERCCHILPNATLAGTVRVGAFAYVGSGAVVVPNLTVEKYSYVGAGAVVIRDVPEGAIVGGVPARLIGRQLRRPAIQQERRAIAN